jgi:hypothetical protein
VKKNQTEYFEVLRGGGKSGRVIWSSGTKKIVKGFRGHLAKIQWVGGRWKNSGRVFLKFWREKIVKGSRGHLAQIQWVGRWKIQAACFEVLERKKKCQDLPRTLNQKFKGGEGGKSGRAS